MNKQRIVSFDYLRVLACFGVVWLHFGSSSNFALIAVSIFMVLATFLGGKLLTGGGGERICTRLKRLYWPFLFWGMLYFLVYSVFFSRFDLKVLLMQMLLGVPACPALYFIFLLMVYTCILYGVFRMKRSVSFSILLIVGCFCLQYSGLNHALFSHLPFDVCMVLGRFVELLPAAILGTLVYLVKDNKKVLGCLAIVGLVIYPLHYVLNCAGFCYQGLGLFGGTMGLTCGALLMPNIKFASKHIGILASLTAGIYYVHLLIGKVMELCIGRNRGFREACGVFLVSAIGVFLLKKVKRLKPFIQ